MYAAHVTASSGVWAVIGAYGYDRVPCLLHVAPFPVRYDTVQLRSLVRRESQRDVIRQIQ